MPVVRTLADGGREFEQNPAVASLLPRPIEEPAIGSNVGLITPNLHAALDLYTAKSQYTRGPVEAAVDAVDARSPDWFCVLKRRCCRCC